MKTRVRICLPAIDVEVQSAWTGNVAIHFLNNAWDDFALGLDVARRGNDDTQYANVHTRKVDSSDKRLRPAGKECSASIAANLKVSAQNRLSIEFLPLKYPMADS